jgi:acyl carrier protein
MTRDEILQGIEAVARAHLEWPERLSPDLDLIEDLELDSLGLLTLAVEVENHFRICLEQEDEAQIRTVADLVAVVERKFGKTPG